MNSGKTESHVHWQPIGELLERKNDGRMPMPGFDEEFQDIVDYIIKITHRIWEQKNAGLCYTYYSDHCPVHTLAGYSDNVEDVVQGTLDTIAAYPDRTLIGENVVWAPHGEKGYYSSHRITSVMTHSGPSEFGPATGRTGRVTTIADCVCEGNRVRPVAGPNSDGFGWLAPGHGHSTALPAWRYRQARRGGDPAFAPYYLEPRTCFGRELKEQVSNHSGLEISYFECIIGAIGWLIG